MAGTEKTGRSLGPFFFVPPVSPLIIASDRIRGAATLGAADPRRTLSHGSRDSTKVYFLLKRPDQI